MEITESKKLSALVKPEIDTENNKENKKRIIVIMIALIQTVMMTYQRVFHPQSEKKN